MLNGYLRAINPEKYLDILKESYVRYEEAIPILQQVWEIFLCGKITIYYYLSIEKVR